jgi:hypothetical protein
MRERQITEAYHRCGRRGVSMLGCGVRVALTEGIFWAVLWRETMFEDTH